MHEIHLKPNPSDIKDTRQDAANEGWTVCGQCTNTLRGDTRLKNQNKQCKCQ